MNSTISEKVELLGKGLYKNIPDELNIHSIPTISELDYVGSEDFDSTMLDKILPEAVDEKINFRELLEIDYHWLCRCLRILNYGPYHTVNTIFCGKCGTTSHGEYQVDLRSIGCNPIPAGFVNNIELSKDRFIDFQGNIKFQLPTIQDIINAYKDKAFQTAEGVINKELARMCYMIKEFNGVKGLTPVEVKLKIAKELSPADYVVLKDEITRLTDFGMRAGGSAQCPRCGHKEAVFIALTDDRFFRTTVDNLRKWRDDRSSGKA